MTRPRAEDAARPRGRRGRAGPVQRRARSVEAKEDRRRELLAHAWRLFQARDWDGVTMDDIAAAVGLSKAAVYRYFETKESLFLAVEQAQLGEWLATLLPGLEALGTDADPAEVGRVVAASLGGRPALARLLSLLHVSVERNVSFEHGLAFKRVLHGWLRDVGRRLEAAVPALPAGVGPVLAVQIHAVCIGLWQMTDSGPVMQALHAHPELQALRVDFEPAFALAVERLLRGAAAPGEAHVPPGHRRAATRPTRPTRR